MTAKINPQDMVHTPQKSSYYIKTPHNKSPDGDYEESNLSTILGIKKMPLTDKSPGDTSNRSRSTNLKKQKTTYDHEISLTDSHFQSFRPRALENLT